MISVTKPINNYIEGGKIKKKSLPEYPLDQELTLLSLKGRKERKGQLQREGQELVED